MKYKIIADKIKNASGLYISVEIYQPECEGVMPAVILFHGFTGYKEEVNLVDIAERLAKRGIVSIRFTTAGFGDSEGTIEHDYLFSTHRKDASCVYNYVNSLPYVDKSRLGICGHSMGGKLALLFCADHPHIKAVCAISAPIHLLSTSYGAKLNDWKRRGYYEKVSGRDGSTIRIPYRYIDDSEAREHNVLGILAKIIEPQALIIAGKNDETVPWVATKELYDGLHCPKEFLLLDHVDHWYKKHQKLLPVVHEPIQEFFVKNL